MIVIFEIKLTCFLNRFCGRLAITHPTFRLFSFCKISSSILDVRFYRLHVLQLQMFPLTCNTFFFSANVVTMARWQHANLYRIPMYVISCWTHWYITHYFPFNFKGESRIILLQKYLCLRLQLNFFAKLPRFCIFLCVWF